jgi:SHS2 domain-containing protein
MSKHAFERNAREVRVHLEGESYAQLLAEGARAVAELMGEPTDDPPGPPAHVVVEAPDRYRLLVVWLNELIERGDVDSLGYFEAEINRVEGNLIDASICGTPIKARKLRLGAATSHGLEIRDGDGEALVATVTIETLE